MLKTENSCIEVKDHFRKHQIMKTLLLNQPPDSVITHVHKMAKELDTAENLANFVLPDKHAVF